MQMLALLRPNFFIVLAQAREYDQKSIYKHVGLADNRELDSKNGNLDKSTAVIFKKFESPLFKKTFLMEIQIVKIIISKNAVVSTSI